MLRDPSLKDGLYRSDVSRQHNASHACTFQKTNNWSDLQKSKDLANSNLQGWSAISDFCCIVTMDFQNAKDLGHGFFLPCLFNLLGFPWCFTIQTFCLLVCFRLWMLSFKCSFTWGLSFACSFTNCWWVFQFLCCFITNGCWVCVVGCVGLCRLFFGCSLTEGVWLFGTLCFCSNSWCQRCIVCDLVCFNNTNSCGRLLVVCCLIWTYESNNWHGLNGCCY